MDNALMQHLLSMLGFGDGVKVTGSSGGKSRE
jgi:hypothetical protein